MCLDALPAPALQHVHAAAEGVRGKTLVINLPGKPKSIRETFDEVFKSIPYCVQLMEGPYIETNAAVVPAFRPPAEKRTARPAAAAAAGEAQGQ
jgi:molybdopterin adenylyltransferase